MSTKTRVPEHTSAEINSRIYEETKRSLDYFSAHPEEIDRRLNELDEEWDIERILEANSSAISIFGLAMGFAVNKRWFILPLVVQTFFMQHAIQGWCPPLPFLRRLGVRTLDEINYERYGLKTIRGDFENISLSTAENVGKISVRELLEAVMH